MGTLANSLFQTMLGWIRALSSEVWNTFSSPEGTTLLGWIGNNWKALALILCVAGAVIDLMVYLFRWQPLRVWRSFFRRMRYSGEEKFEADFPEEAEPVYSFQHRRDARDRGSGREELPEEAQNPPEAADPSEEDFIRERTEPEGTTAAFEEAIRPRRRRMTKLFAEAGEDTATPDQLIDRYAAYRRPVYPRSWKTDEGESEDEE